MTDFFQYLIFYPFYQIEPFLREKLHTSFLFNLFLYITVLIYLNYKILFTVFSPAKALNLYILLRWPGTVVHELAHALGALITGCKIKKIHLLPEKEISGNRIDVTLGYVLIYPPYPGAGVLSSFFPLVVIPFSFFLGFYFILMYMDNIYVIYVYLFFSYLFLIPAMILSKEDIEGFLNNIITLNGIILFTAFFSLLYITEVKFHGYIINIFSFILNKGAFYIINSAVYFTLFNIFVIILLSLKKG